MGAGYGEAAKAAGVHPGELHVGPVKAHSASHTTQPVQIFSSSLGCPDCLHAGCHMPKAGAGTASLLLATGGFSTQQ